MNTHSPMPVVFAGHGSPMYAIEENEFSAGFRRLAETLPLPKAVLCISAHWTTRGTFVTSQLQPPTLHDFGGFPSALYNVKYPAPGLPSLAERVVGLVKSTPVYPTEEWGLDHGSWAVLRRLFPRADVPVVELSLDYRQPAAFHYALGRELQPLRDEGVLIVASGNTVHNLRRIDWEQMQHPGFGYDWAKRVNEKIKTSLLHRRPAALLDYRNQGPDFALAAPTPEHLLPLFYVMALQRDTDRVEFFNDNFIGGSLAMTGVVMR